MSEEGQFFYRHCVYDLRQEWVAAGEEQIGQRWDCLAADEGDCFRPGSEDSLEVGLRRGVKGLAESQDGG